MDGWETVTHEPKQQWGSNNFLSNQGFGDGWGAATSEPQAQSSGRGGAIGGGHSDWQQMTAQMESTFISNGFEQRDVGPQEVEAPAPLEETWPPFKEADESRDLDDVKEALGVLCSSFRGGSWQDMEKKLREEKCNTYLAALDHTVLFGYTLVNLRNEPEQLYRVIPSFIKPGTAKSGRMSIGQASSYEENFGRLAEGGIVRPSGIPKCHNCKQDGHMAKECPEERRPPERSEYFGKCYNCSSEEHRTRHCPEARKVITCNNCGKEGHISRHCSEEPAALVCNRCSAEGHMARDCTEPRTDITCNRCGEVGHMARDCSQPRTDITCNRCGEAGHMARDCSHPRTDIICNRCGEAGHMARDCSQPRYDIQCNRCGDMGHMARDCSQPRPAMICRTCNAEGHIARDCPEKKEACYRCGAEGHISTECDAQSGTTCYSCNQTGHQARDCPDRVRDMSTTTCYSCGESGHMSFECPTKEAGGRRGARKFGFDF
ncbi:hypothetical protein BG003_011732 [Podila horticola]|nr:hypothetical protein BG003_011732 [Podila horticola]